MRHNLRIFAGRDARRIRALEIWRAAFFPDRIHGDLRVGTGAACRIRPRQRPPASSEQNEGRVVFFVTLAFEIRVVPVEPRRSGSSVHAAKTRPSPRHRDRSATRDHRTRRGPGTQPAAELALVLEKSVVNVDDPAFRVAAAQRERWLAACPGPDNNRRPGPIRFAGKSTEDRPMTLVLNSLVSKR